jgi:hypothetical protein
VEPTLTGFLSFIRNAAGIPQAALPDDDVQITYAFNIAVDLTLTELAQASPTIYTLAVYNLGVSNLINWAADQQGQTYFATLRKTWNITGFVGGVIASSADQATSESLVSPDFLKGLTMANLQQMKDPFGRQWLAYQQSYGTIWGIS